MNKAAQDTATALAAALLTHYSFDLGGYSTDELIAEWLLEYPAAWVRLGTIEALYQGRYKALSVTHILACWKRRNQALYHFNHEFERLVSSQLPKGWKGTPDPSEEMPLKEGFAELSQTGLFSRAIPSLDSRPSEQPTSGDNFPQGASLETPAIAPDSENASGSDSAAPIPTPSEPPQAHPLSPELSSIAQGDSEPKSVSPPVINTPGTQETVSAGVLEDNASGTPRHPSNAINPPNTDDLLGDLWLDRPQLQPIRNLKSTFIHLQPSPESAVPEETSPIEDPENGESFEAIVNNSPIHQFTPEETSSDFYSKLKAVSQREPQSPPFPKS